MYTLQVGGETKRTKEAVLLEVVKGSGNPDKMKKLVRQYIESSIKNINIVVEKEGVDGIAFVPPTASRKVQIMRLLESEFDSRNCHKVDRVLYEGIFLVLIRFGKSRSILPVLGIGLSTRETLIRLCGLGGCIKNCYSLMIWLVVVPPLMR